MGSNITFISLNSVLIGAAAFTLSTAIHKYRRALFNYWDNLNTSSETMEIAEILPSTMPQSYITHLQAIDDILSADLSTEATGNAKRWSKFPIYGVFKKEENSWHNYITCNQFKSTPKEHLYGYFYENGDYSVEIKRHFNIRKPKEVNTRNFYRINTVFKNYTKGVKKDPEFSPFDKFYEDSNETESKSSDLEVGNVVPVHQHLNIESCRNVYLSDVQVFLSSFLKEINSVKKYFPLATIKDNPFNAVLKLLETDSRIKLALSGKEYNNKKPITHLYFMFPTHPEITSDKETYSIILHIMQRGKEYLTYEGIIPYGPLYLDTEEESDSLHFTLTRIKGDGDCGFGAIGTTRKKSLGLLKDASDNSAIRKLIAPEIYRALRDGTLSPLIKSKFKKLDDQYEALLKKQNELAKSFSEELGEGEGNLKNFEELLSDSRLSEEKRAELEENRNNHDNNRQHILSLAEDQNIYLEYIKSFETKGTAGSGWLTHTPNEGIEAAIGVTGLYDAIAYLHGINLYIWQVPTDETEAKLIHWYEAEKNNRYAHVLHNGRDHYDMLNCHEKMQRGEKLVNQESSQSQLIKSKVRQRNIKGKDKGKYN